MKGFRLMARTLASIKAGNTTIVQLAEEMDIGYVSMMRLVNELRAAGLIERAGQGPTIHGMRPWNYRYKGGDAIETGRPLTRQFLRLWNALLDPDSAASIADDCGVTTNHTRVTIHYMRSLGLCRIAAWERNRVAQPTALYVIGDGPDAKRPLALPEKEYNRRANEKRKNKKVWDALTWRIAA